MILHQVALATVQQSTASMGKFDSMRPNEPSRKRERPVKVLANAIVHAMRLT